MEVPLSRIAALRDDTRAHLSTIGFAAPRRD
jgi:hypothetical protein